MRGRTLLQHLALLVVSTLLAVALGREADT